MSSISSCLPPLRSLLLSIHSPYYFLSDSSASQLWARHPLLKIINDLMLVSFKFKLLTTCSENSLRVPLARILASPLPFPLAFPIPKCHMVAETYNFFTCICVYSSLYLELPTSQPWSFKTHLKHQCPLEVAALCSCVLQMLTISLA